MNEARVLLALASLLVVALFIIDKGVKPALAPLTVVCATSLYFSVFGCLGLLVAGGWVYFSLAALALGYLVYKYIIKKASLPKLDYGFWFFAFASLAVILVLWIRDPRFVEFDEFSFWGTAAKLMKIFNELYTTAPVGWNWAASYSPGLVSFTYFFQFIGSGFYEWQVYAAYDIITLAVIAAMLAPFKYKHWDTALPVAVIGFLVPFIFRVYATPQYVASPYLDSMGDIPSGLLFGGAIACWYSADSKRWQSLLPVCMAVMMLTSTKDTSFALSILVSGIVLMDMLFRKREQDDTLKQHLAKSGAVFGVVFAAAVLPYLGWSKYLSQLGVGHSSGEEATNISPVTMVFKGIAELFSEEKSERFLTVAKGMPQRFVSPEMKVATFGSGLVVTAVILFMLVFAVVFARAEKQRRKTIVFTVISTLGFLAYSVLIALTYIYIFRDYQVFTDYERYLSPYYIGWFIGAVVLLGKTAKDSRFAVEGRALILGICALFCFYFARTMPINYTFVGFHQDEFEFRREESRAAQRVSALLPEDSLTYLVSQDDNGKKWFTYVFEFLPRQLFYGTGGGRMGPEGAMPEGTLYFYPISRSEWEKQLIENNVTHVFIDDADPMFREEYGPLFADGMDGYFEGDTILYKVVVSGTGAKLMPME